MPTVDKDLLYVPYTGSTVNNDVCSEGGSLYWFYKECRKSLFEAGLLKRKAPKETICVQNTNSNKGKTEYKLMLN